MKNDTQENTGQGQYLPRYRPTIYVLLTTLLVGTVVFCLVKFIWYPDFFFTIDGGWEGIRLVVFVDLVLGPVLALILFKPGKPGVLFDMVIVSLVRVACLVIGVYILHMERPLFLVYSEQQFYSASADEFSNFGIPVPDPGAYGDSSPARVVSALPDDPIEAADLMKILYQSEVPLWIYPRTFKPLGSQLTGLAGIPEAALAEIDFEGKVDDWLHEIGAERTDFAFYPVHARYGKSLMAVRKADGAVTGIVLLH